MNKAFIKQLKTLYLEARLSMEMIGIRFGVSRKTIGKWLIKAGIQRRAYPGKDWLETKYHQEKLDQRAIAIILKTSVMTVSRLMQKYGIPVRSNSELRSGVEHINWNGGRYIDPDGYIQVHVGRHRYRPEHRLIMATIIGRPLLPTEIVHHINENRQDNRPENLKLFATPGEHIAKCHPRKGKGKTLKG